ncbi:MAG TPA: hypothetical protein VGC37_11320 [Friedmanniella sp.]
MRLRAAVSAVAVSLIISASGAAGTPAASATPAHDPTPQASTTVPLVAEPFDGVDDMVWANGHLFVTSVDQVKVLDPDGTIVKRFKRLPGAYDMAVSPQGDRVYVVVVGGAYIVTIDTKRLKVVNQLKTEPATFGVALVGSRLFYSTQKGEHLATIRSIDAKKGGKPRPTGIKGFYDHILLAGGGHTLVTFDPDPDGHGDPYAIKSWRVKGSKVSRQATRDDSVTSLTMAHDDKRVYVTRDDQQEATSFTIPELNHPKSYVHSGSSNVSSLAVSPDGKHVALALTNTDDDLLVFRAGKKAPSWTGRTAWTGPPSTRPIPVPKTLTYSGDGKRLFELVAEPGSPVDDPHSSSTQVYFVSARI